MNTKITNILLIILLVFNVAFIGKWWMGHRNVHHPKTEAPAETTTILHDKDKGEMYLVKTLGFDTAQQKKLDKILQTHFTFLDKTMNVYIRNQNNLFNAVKEGKDSTYASQCSDSLGVLKVAMEKELYMHFNSIKGICNSSQLKQFDELIDNMEKEFVLHHNFHHSANANKDSI